MSFGIRLEDRAERRLAELSSAMRDVATEAIGQIAANPSKHVNRRSSARHGQVAEFQFDRGGAVIWVTVVFRYGQDEQSLHIEDVAVEFG